MCFQIRSLKYRSSTHLVLFLGHWGWKSPLNDLCFPKFSREKGSRVQESFWCTRQIHTLNVTLRHLDCGFFGTHFSSKLCSRALTLVLTHWPLGDAGEQVYFLSILVVFLSKPHSTVFHLYSTPYSTRIPKIAVFHRFSPVFHLYSWGTIFTKNGVKKNIRIPIRIPFVFHLYSTCIPLLFYARGIRVEYR